ncbi:Protein argonaute-2 [Mycena sanguinolenta]|uniref:Protein argonaute-2 n=1 Tax=Mycena sanguinolenta TaxID=230812 RepID=A0A8H6YXX1_9AGAR|nr:Protein argonaute-2 [Mycena sanguinolenta]
MHATRTIDLSFPRAPPDTTETTNAHLYHRCVVRRFLLTLRAQSTTAHTSLIPHTVLCTLPPCMRLLKAVKFSSDGHTESSPLALTLHITMRNLSPICASVRRSSPARPDTQDASRPAARAVLTELTLGTGATRYDHLCATHIMPPRGQNRPENPGTRGGFRGTGGPRGGPRGGYGGSGARTAPQPAHQPAPQHITTIGVRRPDYGSSGRPLNINVNSFTARIPNSNIYHYDGAWTLLYFSLELIFLMDIISADKVLPAAMNMRLIEELQNHVAPHIFAETRCVFDGKKNLYAPVELDLGSDSRQFDVSLPGAPVSSDRPPKIYKITLTLVATINTEVLHRFIQGIQSYDNTVSTALMALNVVIRMEPSQRFPIKGRSFFTEQGSKAIGAGLVLWRGYFQSIRPAVNRMLINVDISTGVMYQPGPLIKLCLSFLNLNPNDPLRLTRDLDDRQRIKLGRFIAGIRVRTEDASRDPDPKKAVTRARVVRKLTQQGASNVTFVMRGGRTLTVAKYYEETTGRPLRFPTVLCVELVRKEVPDEKKADLVAFATKAPKDRLESIKNGMEVLAYGQSEYVRKFGLQVDPNVLATKARVLRPPTLKYGTGGKAATVEPRNGSWNMADKKFYRPATIAAWVLVVLDTRLPDRLLEDVGRGLVQGCISTGMTVTHQLPTVRRVNPQSKIPDQLQLAGTACYQQYGVAPTLFTVILPEGGNDIYTIVKHWGDVTKGVVTQCLKSRNCTRANMQFWANVALKINAKLGGINVITDPTQGTILSDPRNPTVVMGADVMHPGAGTNGRPSYAAVVSSVDSNAAKYVAIQSVQASRQELISDLEGMTAYTLGKYMSYRTAVENVPQSLRAPTRLIFYRDGVSEGQFQQVLDQELPLIKAACEKLNIAPKITLVIVGKRHHVRLFPMDGRDADRSGNCPAGTVVDRDIGHPTEFDFYLQSHAGILGTSRPGHYSVLYDENNLNADTMQALSFALTHVYAGSTRSVSIPAPVYYADTVCARAKIHFDPEKIGGDFSESGVTDTTETLEAYKRDFMALHSNQTGRMYFS